MEAERSRESEEGPIVLTVGDVNEITSEWLVGACKLGSKNVEKIIVPKGTLDEARELFNRADREAGEGYGRNDAGYLDSTPEIVEAE
ncbi:MAG: hypothetical protein ABIJ46_01510 [bacterium]